MYSFFKAFLVLIRSYLISKLDKTEVVVTRVWGRPSSK